MVVVVDTDRVDDLVLLSLCFLFLIMIVVGDVGGADAQPKLVDGHCCFQLRLPFRQHFRKFAAVVISFDQSAFPVLVGLLPIIEAR